MTASEPTVQQLFDLTGKTALLTGASGWLGGAFARALAEAGASVIASSRDLSRAEAVAAELPSPGGAKHHAVSIDQIDEPTIEAGFAAAVEQAGQVDILINNGHAGSGLDWTNVTGEEFNRQLSNATGYFLLARNFRNHIVERDAQGNIVIIGSMYGVVASYPDAYAGVCAASPVAYHALKGGLVHMTRHLAAYWAGDGIRVNCLSPGPFPNESAPAEMVERLEKKNPMQRMGVPYELKGALLLLASDAGSYITGQNLLVDGGWTAW
ncbi:MAG: SDR family NAD(P)-dependent oxidoreductase [Planctomycetota bacterium]|nr:MAG: SDR family NAD(P)-dependent oxidoreductase [Planctomycetota bacterium]REJ94269.1 MAG: SDR family NAD(P)-dependent oxidoreductase [Planctomycetota bacterium]REK20242.1 MAG: SDR family NAD(P)-dependent oxidoreductase [Planctomycetota bacterium]REK35425.1 MAG: SDR family NAD(P)-dependent oxidoreductase [Planctomycetota bacterium]